MTRKVVRPVASRRASRGRRWVQVSRGDAAFHQKFGALSPPIKSRLRWLVDFFDELRTRQQTLKGLS
jgi:hypothetical protein